MVPQCQARDGGQVRAAESAVPTALPTPASLGEGQLEDDTVCCSVLALPLPGN